MISLFVKILLLPFTLVWGLVGIIFTLLGKLITAGLGVLIMIIGLILCLTVIALPLGVIFIIFGFLMTIKGIF